MKRENLKRANIVEKLLGEVELQITNLENFIQSLSHPKEEGQTVDLRTSSCLTNFFTLYHIFTVEDLVGMSNIRKDILIQNRRDLLTELETL